MSNSYAACVTGIPTAPQSSHTGLSVSASADRPSSLAHSTISFRLQVSIASLQPTARKATE